MNKKITVLSMAYNEEFLLPFFLKHYSWVDNFKIFFDTDSSDKTLEILKNDPRVEIIPFTFPDGMDDLIKIKLLNEEYSKIKDGIVLLLDIDEFIFSDRKTIETIPENSIVTVSLFNVYRHISETDLNINFPIESQRRHGFLDPMYNKPIIVNAGLEIQWCPGNHFMLNKKGIDLGIIGAHWANADPCFCVERRVKNRSNRQSKVNLENKLTYQHHYLTEQKVIDECFAHREDPQIW